MGRELKRVALDFVWPIDKVWEGFLNPHYKGHCENCEYCDGSGESPEAKNLSKKWYGRASFEPADRGSVPFDTTSGPVRALAERHIKQSPEFYGTSEFSIVREAERLAELFNAQWSHHLNQSDVDALVKEGRLMDFTHSWTRETKWVKKDPEYHPTAHEVNDWSIQGFGHDSINQWIVVKAEALRLGIETQCEHCKGEGSLWDSEESRQTAENWTQSEPPEGEGYQIWETVSEGSPISPVFAKPEDLANWMVDNSSRSSDSKTSYTQWMNFILGDGWAPSMVIQGGVLMSGVQACEQADQASN